jgi:hypothetical protein
MATGFSTLLNDGRIGLATWYTLKDWGETWGIYDINNNPKQSYWTFKSIGNHCPTPISRNEGYYNDFNILNKSNGLEIKSQKVYSVKILDMAGRTIYNDKIIRGNKFYKLKTGIYYMIINDKKYKIIIR